MVAPVLPVTRPARSWTERPDASPAVNVGDTERLISVVGGGVLLAAGLYGLSKGSWTGLVAGVIGGSLVYRGTTGHCSLYQAIGVSSAAPAGDPAHLPAQSGVKVEQSVTINRPRDELYRYWRNFENLPKFMRHLKSVTLTGSTTHWVAHAPLGMSVEWHAEVLTEREPEVIAWRSLTGSEIETAGSVHFKPVPNGGGTEVHVSLKYEPWGGKVGAVLAKLFGEAPEQQIVEDLRRFKQMMETGEIPTTSGQPYGGSFSGRFLRG